MKRSIVTLLCTLTAAALLAGCGPDTDATPAMPESAPTATGESTPSAAPSGTDAPAEQKADLRPLTQGTDSAYYTFGQGQGEDGMHLILYAIDYDTQQAAPVCTKAGCSHDTPGCEAWLPDQNYRTIGSDGQEVVHPLHRGGQRRRLSGRYIPLRGRSADAGHAARPGRSGL